MTDLKAINDQLDRLKTLLQENQDYLKMGLNEVSARLHSAWADQWRFRVRVYGSATPQGELEYEEQDVVMRIADIPNGDQWTPQVGQTWVPMRTYHQPIRVVQFWREPYPPAVEAQQRWKESLPQTERLANGEVKQLQELIELPERMKTFVGNWFEIQERIAPLAEQFKELDNIDYDLMWEGGGHEAYLDVLNDNSKAAAAVYEGIDRLLSGLIEYLMLALGIVQVLVQVAKTRIDDIGSVVNSILSVDPKKWKELVEFGIGRILEANAEHATKLREGVDSWAAGFSLQFDLMRQFTALKRVLGSQTIEWPAPRAQMVKRWDSAPA